MKRKVVKKRVFQKPEKDDAKSKAQKKQSDARSPKKDELQKTDEFRILGLRRSYFAIAVLVLGMMAAGAILNDGLFESPRGSVIEFNVNDTQNDTSNASSVVYIKELEEQIVMCNEYLAASDYNKSIECLNKALEIKNDDFRILVALGDLYSIMGEYNESLVYYSQAVFLEPDEKRIRYNYAVALENANMSDEAILQYMKALEINESYVMARNNLGVLYQRQGMLNESRQQFEMALYYEPNNTVALLNYANLLAETGFNGEAEVIYKKVISIDPENKDAYRNYAQFLYNKGRYIEAKDMLEKS